MDYRWSHFWKCIVWSAALTPMLYAVQHSAGWSQIRTDAHQLPRAYIETTRDGIAQLPVAQLLRVVPSLRGLPSDGLHVRRRGYNVPLIFRDHDGRISDDDTVLFVGSRPSGDTTYFDAYTDRAAFEVWYDLSLPPRRFILDTTATLGQPVRRHLWIERHLEQDREYVQGWLDADRYRETQSTFVTETVPGEGWVWAITYPLRPFGTLLPIAPDPETDDSVEVAVIYSAISDDIYTNPDHRIQCLYAGVLRDSASYDGPRYDTARVVIRPRRDGCIVDSIVVRNSASTIAAEAVDYISTRGRERAATHRDYVTGFCQSMTDETIELVNFASSQVIVIDTLQGVWSRRHGERGVFVRIAARQNPQRLGIAMGDTSVFVTRRPVTVAWLDQQQKVQVFSESASAVAGLIGALPVGTPFAVLIADGQSIDQTLRDQLAREGSSVSPRITSGMAYVGCGIRGDPTSYRENLAAQSATLVAWLASERGNAYRAAVPLSRGSHVLIASGEQAIENARVRLCGGSELYADTNRADYLVITHRDFRTSAERLATYRSQRNGVRARVVDVQDIFDAFGRGEKSPHAIKAFLRYAHRQWGAPPPRAVVLVGDASWDPRRVSAGAVNEDFIPSYGKPTSDYWYSLLEGDDYIPELSIGRLPVTTPEQAESIIDKIIEHDTTPPARWQKRVLFITGGANAAEQVDFYESVIYSLLPLLVDPYQHALCADTVFASFYAGTADGSPIPSAIVGAINSGVAWVNYIGHGAPRSLEVAGWEPERLRNGGRYPILASFSCQIGAFAEPSVQALGEDFLTAPAAGMVAVIATTGFGIRSYDDIVNAGIFATLARSRDRWIGDVLNRAKLYLFDGSQLAINTLMQTSLLGDPLTRFPIDSVPHPVVDASSLAISSVPPAPTLTANADSAIVNVTVFNAGIYADSIIPIRLVRIYQQQRDTLRTVLSELCYPERLRFALPIRSMAGEHVLRIELDDSAQDAHAFTPLQVPMYVYAEQLYPVEPQPGWNIAPTDTIVRFLNSFGEESPFTYHAVLLSDAGDTVATSNQHPVATYPTHCQWTFPPVLSVGKAYRAIIVGHNTRRGTSTPPMVIPFVVTDRTSTNHVDHRQGYGSGWSRSRISGMTITESGELSLAESVDVELLSAGGYQFSPSDTARMPIQPAYRLRIDGTNVASERNDEIGVHVAVISSHTGQLKAVRWYATWTTTPINRSDGGASDLIAFLRDTVSSYDYVLLTSCGGAWDLQWQQYAATFGRVLAEYGGQYADSLRGTRSYVFVGMRASNRPFVLERIGTDLATGGSDTVVARFQLPIFPLEGRLVLPTAGPAERWNALHADIQPPTAAVQLAVYGSSSTDGQSQLIYVADTLSRALDDIDATAFPYVQIVCTVRRDTGDFSPRTIRGVQITYTPLPEFAVTVDASERSPLRGDTVSAVARAINLVSRCGVRTAIAGWTVVDREGVPISVETFPTRFSLAVGDTLMGGTLPTLTLPEETTLEFFTATRDIYQFNNRARIVLTTRPDTLAPRVRLLVGGIEASDTTIVPRTAQLECALLDSARVPITDSTALVLRLNGLRLPEGAVRYEFYPTSLLGERPQWRTEPLARAVVTADVLLEYGVNVLLVTARDAFGNTTVARYVLIVPRELQLDSATVFPNPAPAGQQAIVAVTYHGFEQQVSARFELYDLLGKRVMALPVVLQNGANQLSIPLVDHSGGVLQSGVYYWRMWIEQVGVDAAVGGMLVVLQ